MTTKITEIDALLKALAENPDTLLGDELTDRVALKRLTPVVRWLHKSGMRPSEIVEWLTAKLHIETTTAQITKLLPRKPKPKSGTNKKDETAGEATTDTPSATSEQPDGADTVAEKNDSQTAAATKPKPEKPEPITLTEVQEWREKDGVVVLKTTTPIKAKTRIYTESGKIAEVSTCRPTTYGSGMFKDDGLEVSFIVEKS